MFYRISYQTNQAMFFQLQQNHQVELCIDLYVHLSHVSKWYFKTYKVWIIAYVSKISRMGINDWVND